MSFNTGGHAVYMNQPEKASASHAVQASSGSLVVFTTVPSGQDPEEPQALGSVVPERTFGGRVVG